MSTNHIISPTLHTAGLAGMEALINKLLALDPASQYKLKALENHCFSIRCTSPTIELFLIPTAGEINLRSVYEDKPSTRLVGKASDYIELLQADEPASQLINGELQLEGNSQALIELQKILHSLDLDWEAALSKPFGDVIGHQLGKGIRQGLKAAFYMGNRAKEQLQDFLLYESGVSAQASEVEQFNDQVDNLVKRTERLEARFKRWQQHNS